MADSTSTSSTSTTYAPFGSYTNGLISNAGQIAATDASTIADISYGAQLGIGPNLPQIDGSTPLVMMPTVAIVTHIPDMFADISNAPETLKALVERHAKEISGIDFGYQLEGSPTPVGQDGQEAHMPTNSKRTPVTPTFTWQELQGNLIWNFHKNWIEMIKHPDTQASMLSALYGSDTMYPMLFSSFTMDVLFIQFDSTMRPENIIDGWFITNMWPQETGLIGAKRQIGHNEMPERQIAYYGVLQHNRNTKAVAQIIAQTLELHKVNYDFAVPATGGGNTAVSTTQTAMDSNIDNLGIQLESTDNQADFTAIDTTTTTSS